MPRKVQILLNSSSLYEKLYRTFCDGRDENFPSSFDTHGKIRFRLVHGLPDDRLKTDQNRSINRVEAAFMDERYDSLREPADHDIRTIWYNPGGEIVSEGMPVQDVDFVDLEALKDILTLLHKPSLAQCFAWWEEWDVPENIRRHSSVVARSAYLLAVKMRNKGITLDPILAHRAGLLHDIDKIDTLDKSGAHGVMGADFLDEQGYPEVGEIVRDHIMSTILHPDAESRSWENKLVFFCDKLVEGDVLVPFNQRLAALKERYPHYVETMERAESPIWDLSNEICGKLGIPSHGELIEMLKEMH